jgi:heterodisulfide reductase subunit A
MKTPIGGPAHGEVRVGVYICHCGTNIAGTVDVEAVSNYASTLDNVVVARHYAYMCSDPGQSLIKEDIKNEGLDRVVVASCSPLMHEPTFRKACAEAGLNPFLFQMTNIREHCSWVTDNRSAATEKAQALVAAAVRRVAESTGDAPGGRKAVRAGGRRRDRGDRGRAPPGRFG